MKPILIALLMPMAGLAQKADPDTLSFSYVGVEQVESASAKVLQGRAKLLVAEAFKSAKDVIQLDDGDAGILIVKGNIVPVVKAPLMGSIDYGFVRFTLKIQVKDGRYKYTFSDFNHEAYERNMGSGGDLTNKKPACGTFVMTKGYWRQIKTYTDEQVVSLIARLDGAMKGAGLAKKDEF